MKDTFAILAAREKQYERDVVRAVGVRLGEGKVDKAIARAEKAGREYAELAISRTLGDISGSDAFTAWQRAQKKQGRVAEFENGGSSFDSTVVIWLKKPASDARLRRAFDKGSFGFDFGGSFAPRPSDRPAAQNRIPRAREIFGPIRSLF
jgi:hypothetical protein